MEDLEFDWDANNVKHLFQYHPQRKLSIEEIESVFRDEDGNSRRKFIDSSR